MKKLALLFPTFTALNEFELQMETCDYQVDENSLVITGMFNEREIEFALNAYAAKVIEVEE